MTSPLHSLARRGTVIVASLATAALALSVSPASAVVPDGIFGVVTVDGFAPGSSVRVTAYSNADPDGWESVAGAFTAPDGSYTLPLPSGDYRLAFDDDSGDATSEFYDDVQSFNDAETVAVVEGAPVEIDADLAPASHVTGTVTGGDLTESTVYVTAYQEVIEDEYTSWERVATTNTDGLGEYDLGGLPAGTYRIGFEPEDNAFATEFYDDVSSVRLAEDLVLDASTPAAGIDAVLDPAGSITGAMTDDEGEPTVGHVSAFNVDGPEWEYVANAGTGLAGSYRLEGLRAGSYLVVFDEDATGRSEYWEDTDDSDLATLVEVEAGLPTTDISAEMDDKTPPAAVENLEQPTISGVTEVGSTLTADPGEWDAPGVTFTYQWISGNDEDAAIPGATGSTYVLDESDVDDYIGVIVTASADGYSTAFEYSDYVGPVQALTVHNLSQPTISGTPQVGSTLTANPGTWDQPDVTFEYQWETYKDGQEHTDHLASGQTYVPTADIVGQPVWVTVVASAPGVGDGYASTETVGPVSAAPPVTPPVVTPPVVTPPVVTPPVVVPPVVVPPTDVDEQHTPKVAGAKKVGSTLKAKSAAWVPDDAKVKYQWLVNGKVIKKATKAKLKLLEKFAGKKISVKVTATSPGSLPVSVTTKVGKVKR